MQLQEASLVAGEPEEAAVDAAGAVEVQPIVDAIPEKAPHAEASHVQTPDGNAITEAITEASPDGQASPAEDAPVAVEEVDEPPAEGNLGV